MIEAKGKMRIKQDPDGYFKYEGILAFFGGNCTNNFRSRDDMLVHFKFDLADIAYVEMVLDDDNEVLEFDLDQYAEMTLNEFLGKCYVTNVWFSSVGSPAGVFCAVSGEYDEQTLLNMRPIVQAGDLTGRVTFDPKNGKARWEVLSLKDVDVRDDQSNTVFDLVVWGNGFR
jgi:hypothetical protein